ncbi:MAG: tetratricopeptide repeat protein [Bacteroidetes bacterium]|nr:tetratricopeptide repeat protein [Bacteroidota bacterium]
MAYATQAFDLALKLRDSSRIIRGGRIKSAELRRLEHIDDAIVMALYILRIARRHKDTTEIKSLLNSLGTSHILRGEYDQALRYQFESLVIREKGGNKKEISIILNNIGVCYYKLNDIPSSIKYFKRCLELKRESNDKYGLDRLLINIGLCVNEMGNYAEAIKYITEGLNSCDGKCTDQIILEGEIALGDTFYDAKLFSESLKHLKISYQIAKRIDNFRFQVENILYFARIHLIKKDFEMAIRYLNEAENISLQKGYKFLLIDTYEVFSKLFNEIKDYKSASLYLSKYIAYKDSVFNEKVTSNLAQLHADFEERENLKTIAEKNQMLSLREELIQKQKIQLALMAAIALLLTIVAIMLYKIYRDKLLINIKLDQKVKERTEELRENNRSLTTAYELQQSKILKVEKESLIILSSVSGLCHAARLELTDGRAKEYIQKVANNIDQLSPLFKKTKEGE